MEPQTKWGRDLDFLGPRDVIGHVVIQSALPEYLTLEPNPSWSYKPVMRHDYLKFFQNSSSMKEDPSVSRQYSLYPVYTIKLARRAAIC